MTVYTLWKGWNVAFIFHAAIEIPAAVNFMFYPDTQLHAPAPQAHAIIRQYATLLISSVLIALAFVRKSNTQSRSVAGGLCIYHLAPFLRSCSRLLSLPRDANIINTEPFLYALVHLAGGSGLLLHFLGY